MRLSAYALAAASLVAVPSSVAAVESLDSLTVEGVQSLLALWNLDAAFGDAFVADRVDGKTLQFLQVEDLQHDKHYPNARHFHARRLIAERDALVGLTTTTSDARGTSEVTADGLSQRQRRSLLASGVSSESSGVMIKRNNSCLAMGETLDVTLCRDGDRSLRANTSLAVGGQLAVDGDASFVGDVSFTGSAGDPVTMKDVHGDVVDLQDALGEVATTVSANADNVAVNTADIAANADLALSNALNISVNTDNIATNAVDIAALSTRTMIPPTRLDQALKEARCSRVNCCNEESEYADDDTLHCWSSQYESFGEDPCGCTVKFVEQSGVTWAWHQRYCVDVLGGHLFSVHSDTAAQIIAGHSTGSSSIFISLHDYLVEDDWRNSDGTPTNWISWGTGEPNDSNGEDCAEIYPLTSTMNDIGCDTVYDTRYASACTVMEPQTHSPEAVMDIALQEARCSRINCCNEAYAWVNNNTVQCWSNSFTRFEQDPCGCTVIMTDEPSSSWKWHEKHCIDELGGQMTSFHSANAVSILDEYSANTDSASLFVGLHDYISEDTWMFTDGTPTNYVPWNTGEPNDSNVEDCAELILGGAETLNDIDCDTVYETRTAGACTVMSPTRNQRDVTEDQAELEARCSRMNCCNENYEWVDGNTLHCWANNYEFFESDPCGCRVEFVEKQTTWTWHERYCVEQGGQLLSVHSETAAGAVAEFSTSSSSVYIGLHDYLQEDAWMNTDGTAANWLGWNTGEPNDSNSEDCAEVNPSTSGLNDIGCDIDYNGRYASACAFLGK